MQRIETAYHEAGHLVADLVYNLKPTGATVIKNGTILGSVSVKTSLRPKYSEQERIDAFLSRTKLKPVLVFDPFDENEQRIKRIGKRKIISLLAGFAAQKKHSPIADIFGSDDDFSQAADIAEIVYYFPKKYQKKDAVQDFYQFLMDRYMPMAEKFVDEHWGEITYVANLLYKKKTLWEQDIDELYPFLRRLFPGFK